MLNLVQQIIDRMFLLVKYNTIRIQCYIDCNFLEDWVNGVRDDPIELKAFSIHTLSLSR